jgi:hypothetical protein
LRLIDGHGKCRVHRELATMQSERHSLCLKVWCLVVEWTLFGPL